MALDYGYFEPRELAAVVKQIPPAHTFLKDRYFPTEKVFMTKKVRVEYKDGVNILAPFVSPRKNGVVDYRNGYSVNEYEPANIAPKRIITTDDLEMKQMGEAQYSGMSPAERAVNIAKEDLTELDLQITMREEWMAAQTMLNNGCAMPHIADKPDEYSDMYIQFYEGENNPAVYTPAVPWGEAGADIFTDLYFMIKMLTRRGLPATDVILGEDVASVFMEDEKILKYLDNRRVMLGELKPEELPNGAAKLMELNVRGHKLGIYTYDAVYTDDKGNSVEFIPKDRIVMSAPGAGRRAYGKVTYVNGRNQKFETVAAKRIARQTADEDHNTFTTHLTSKPLFMPIQKNPWISSSVLK